MSEAAARLAVLFREQHGRLLAQLLRHAGTARLAACEDALQQAKASEAVFRSVQDPVQRSPNAERPENDWTIKRPQPQKVEDPPPEPISKRLLEFLRSMWRASGSVVEMSQPQAQIQNAPLNQNNPQATPGVLAKEELTYTPSKIKKNEKL